MTETRPSQLQELVLQPVREIRWAAVDVETTGLYPDRGDRICEVAVVDSEDEEWSSLVNPRRRVSAGARRVSGISDGLLQNAPAFESVADELWRRLEGRVVVGYNASFPVGFLRAEIETMGHRLDSLLVVDLGMAARSVLNREARSLGDLAETCGLSPVLRHRALDDARLTARIFARLVQQTATDAPLSYLFPRPGDCRLESPDAFGPVLLRIEEALRAGAELTISYHSPWRGTTTDRRVVPLHLSEDYYLDAFCRLRGERRRFRIDRIRAAHLQKTPLSPEATR